MWTAGGIVGEGEFANTRSRQCGRESNAYCAGRSRRQRRAAIRFCRTGFACEIAGNGDVVNGKREVANVGDLHRLRTRGFACCDLAKFQRGEGEAEQGTTRRRSGQGVDQSGTVGTALSP